jgi:hypothetical protein
VNQTSAAPLPMLAPDESRAATVSLSPAKRAALVACFNGGSLHKRDGVWKGLFPTTFDKPVAGVTVADLARDGMLMLSMLPGCESASSIDPSPNQTEPFDSKPIC